MKNLFLSFLIICAACSVFAGTESVANVKDFGAKGDGVTDDTRAFKKAVTLSRERKIPVFVPRGEYRLTDTLDLREQSLKGGEPGAWNADSAPMARLIIDHEKGPGLHMKKSSSLYGIALMYDEKKPDTRFPPAILLDGVGINLQNLRLQYCWDGIACHPKNGAGRVNIENVFIVSCGGCGVSISGTLDIATLRNIEVWNNLHRPNVTAFSFGYNDGISCLRLFSMSNHTGFRATDPPEGWRRPDKGTWGTFTDCATDATSISWDISGRAEHQLGITGGLYWGHHKFLQISNPNARLVVSGCQIKDNGAPSLDLSDAGQLTVSGCSFGRAMNCAYPFVNAKKVKSLSLTGCTFDENSPVLSIGPECGYLFFTGNLIQPSDHPFFREDKRGAGSNVMISGNMGRTP